MLLVEWRIGGVGAAGVTTDPRGRRRRTARPRPPRTATMNTVSRARHGTRCRSVRSGCAPNARASIARATRSAWRIAPARAARRSPNQRASRGERTAAAVGAAHAVRLADDVELVPEPRHEPERGQRRVADAVRHAQLLHGRAHEVGPGRRQPGDEGERDDRGEPQRRGEADLRGRRRRASSRRSASTDDATGRRATASVHSEKPKPISSDADGQREDSSTATSRRVKLDADQQDRVREQRGTRAGSRHRARTPAATIAGSGAASFASGLSP